jgi:hypothetical protein
MNQYTDMTDEEYDALDEELTRIVPKTGPNGTGWLSQMGMYKMGLDNLTINYLITKAKADDKTPAEIIGEMVREKIAVSL